MTTISIVHQRLDISDVRTITVSEIVDDAGAKLRVIRFFGDPIVNGAPTPFAEVACRSENASDLEIQAPGFKF